MAGQRILVTGAAGNLGQDLLAFLVPYGQFEVIGTTSRELNLLEPTSVIQAHLDAIQPDIIINPAAFTAVDGAEGEFEKALQVNAKGPEALAQWAQKNNAYLVHISTDYVFDGAKGSAYTTQDTPHPLNRYGISKLEGEKAVLSAHPQGAAVVRTSWLFGSGNKNFVPFVLNAAQVQSPIRVADDQWGTPTWTGNLCQMLFQLIQERPSGMFHGCCQGSVSRFEQAQFLCQALGVSADFMTPASTASFNFPAKRPQNTAMVPSFTSAMSWQDATEAFLREKGLLGHYVC
jgi:dTDP-4-dehydrorhamnose reductase